MITKIISDRIIIPPCEYFDGNLYFDDSGVITAVTKENLECDKEIDARGLIVSPGFIDMHTHGAGGEDFSAATPEGAAAAIDVHLSHGTTTILPTVTSFDPETVKNALKNINKCKKDGLTHANIHGAHLEGPFFSPAQCGAQSTKYLTPPNPEVYEDIVESSHGIISRWSYAPELDADGKFCRYLTKNGIIPSAGHTDATYPELSAAYDDGCRLITHLYSCTSTVTRKNGYRILGVIETAYLLDGMDVEIIADGKHLPPELIRLISKIKGDRHIALVTDSLPAAGTDALTSRVGDTECIVEDGVCKLPDRTAFAGSIATADRLVRVCVKEAGIPIPSAVRMMTETPARILSSDRGVLCVGHPADIVIFDDGIDVKSVIAGGITVK